MAITSARMQVKRGNESEFDPEKMLPGEWALSIDKKIVRICIAPNVCIRMATYDAFEVDMAKIEKILEECQTIEEAVKLINSEVSEKLNAVIEYTNQAKQYRDEAKQFRDEAETFTPDGYTELQETVASNTAKIDTIIEKAELNIKNTASGENIHLTDSADGKNVAFGLYGKAEQNGEPTPDYPQEITVSGSDGSVEVKSCGKNLLKPIAPKTQTTNGITFTSYDDGTILVSGTATANATTLVLFTHIASSIMRDDSFVGKEIVLNGCPKGGSSGSYRLQWYRYNSVDNAFDYGDGTSPFTVTNDGQAYSNIAISIASGTKVNNLVFKPMIRLASDTDDTYEPYTETTSTIPTPDGLAGIPVESGGNYTDENGQHWVCDEIVKYANGSGKRVQRIGKTIFDGSEDEGWATITTSQSDVYRIRTNVLSGIAKAPTDNNKTVLVGLSNIFKMVPAGTNGTWTGVQGISMNATGEAIHVYSDSYNTSDVSLWTAYLAENPMTLYYELAEPIITDLSAEEIAEIEKLHTFYPITNISNDADCGMSVTYLCDAKNYIDNRLALIETALVNSI